MNWIKKLFGFSGKAPSLDPTGSPEAQKTLLLLNDYVACNGGLSGVLRRFEQGGFTSKVRSWVSAGPNRPINSVEALQLIGWDSLRDMAKKSGISVDRLRDLLAELLPVVIDRATPEGKLTAAA